jgi:hypothetical protein
MSLKEKEKENLPKEGKLSKNLPKEGVFQKFYSERSKIL